MNVEIKEAIRRYHVSFEQNRSKKFTNGRPQTVTTCKIWLLGGKQPQLIGEGVTTLGRKDKSDSLVACRIALTRALGDAKLGRYANSLFWQEFQLRHRHPKFTNIGGTFSGLPRKLIDAGNAFNAEARLSCGHRLKAKGSGTDWCTEHGYECTPSAPCSTLRPVHGYGGLYSHQRRAMKKMMAMSNPIGRGPAAFYAHRRHEYSDKNVGNIIASYHDMPVKPRNKSEELRKMYSPQAEGRCHRVGQPVHNITITNTVAPADQLKKLLHGDAARKQILDILGDNARRQKWLQGVWAVADERLTAKMLAMSLNANELFKKIDAELLSRPGITKVHDEYIIDADKFVPAFKTSEIVTYMGDKARVFSVHGPLVIIHSDGVTYDVFDHELEKRPHWLRRAGRAVAKWWSETDIDRLTRANTEVKKEDHGRGLWKLIDDDYCGSCHGKTI